MTLRQTWIDHLTRIADPVLHLGAQGCLKSRMPVEQPEGTGSRSHVSYFEAIARLLNGMAPWLELQESASATYAEQARSAIAFLTDPASDDYAGQIKDSQPLVDAAFLAQALLRAPTVLWEPLASEQKRQVIQFFKDQRRIKPFANNWLLFAAMIEAALLVFGEKDWDPMRVDYALKQHMLWYKGDGMYGDGPNYHFDYYNAFVIHPMLVDLLACVLPRTAYQDWGGMEEAVHHRARRFAGIQERMISPEGTFPPLGRSLAYRCGAMQGLAHAALRGAYPINVTPAQARGALNAVIARSLDAPETFTSEGWLRIGFCGAQVDIAESYISTGSLYLCTTAFLPLGLPVNDLFWTEAEKPWTSALAWSGQAFKIDHALYGT